MARKPIPTSPFAPEIFPDLPPIAGITLATTNCGIRYVKRDDLLLAVFPKGTSVAGIFTKSLMPGAPVDWCKSILAAGKARALVVNSGISNVFTGKKGKDIIANTVKATMKLVGCAKEEVWIASTGVIGVPLDDAKLTTALPGLYNKLSDKAWKKAAGAILTTDTFPKLASRTAVINGVLVTLNGFAKGSGMIAPDMATMLGFLFTDATIPSPILQKIFAAAISPSFNSITVDSDTSTSDTVLLFATNQTEHKAIASANDPALKDFKVKLLELMIELAQAVVKDGEGITKFITITVSGAVTAKSARIIGLAIANSPLVKTAIAGEDANWGRIVAAVGKAGQKADRDKMSIYIGGVLIAKKGQIAPDYVEAPTAKYMKGRNIDIAVDVGVGKGRATVWTCDLTHGYIDINADYRS